MKISIFNESIDANRFLRVGLFRYFLLSLYKSGEDCIKEMSYMFDNSRIVTIHLRFIC